VKTEADALKGVTEGFQGALTPVEEDEANVLQKGKGKDMCRLLFRVRFVYPLKST
jgi:hypothetical protein